MIAALILALYIGSVWLAHKLLVIDWLRTLDLTVEANRFAWFLACLPLAGIVTALIVYFAGNGGEKVIKQRKQ